MSRKILIVDDSRTVRTMMERELTRAGFEVIEAVNGDDALEKIQAHEDTALMISDINMPWKDGLELLSELRQMDKFKNLPVMLVTTESSQDTVAKARALGISGFLVKPVASGMVAAAAQKLLKI